MKRIRYKNDNGVLTSGIMLSSNGKMIQARINPDTVTASIWIDNEMSIALMSHTLHSLKILVKKKINEMGVQFIPELRNRGQ